VLKTLPADSVDAIVTDPPYGLAFMGKRWDYDVPSEAIWRECLRVLKPGGHLLAFAGTRTQHRMAVRIEDAGFEIRDLIAWVYGSGFPKSLDVSKAIDKAAGVERTEVIGVRHRNAKPFDDTAGWNPNSTTGDHAYTAPATEAARQWAGWGTALKPALEPITVARKPLIGTVAENVLAHGTGALNVDGCRVKLAADEDATALQARSGGVRGFANEYVGGKAKGAPPTDMRAGRWPANLIHDGSDEVVGLFPSQAGGGFGVRGGHSSEHLKGKKATYEVVGFGDTGSAARFFYCAKASKRDRDEGCEGTELRQPSEKTRRHPESVGLVGDASNRGQTANPFANGGAPSRNHHPTVKPTDLMRYLCRLVTPPGGTVLDPFMGSGSTGKAAMLEGFDFIGIERDAEYVKIAEARIGAARRLL
jgi:site-specific DNA-methyltransferase (adenine-specific)